MRVHQRPEPVPASVILHPASLKGCVLAVIREDEQALSFRTVNHTLRENMYVRNCACFHRACWLTIAAKLHAPNCAATHARNQPPKILLFLANGKQFHQRSCAATAIALVHGCRVQGSAVATKIERDGVARA
jgi:hypothetical protein